MFMLVHLCLGVGWKHSCITAPFHVTLFTPMKAKVTIVWLCLVIQDNGRSRAVGTTRDRTPSSDGGSMWLFPLVNKKSLELRLGGATRGKWRIPEGKVDEWTVFMFVAPKVVTPPKSIKDRSLGPSEQVRLCTGAYKIYGAPQT
jgi:hypothetical protein